MKIPKGKVKTYKEVAIGIKMPKSDPNEASKKGKSRGRGQSGSRRRGRGSRTPSG